MRLFVFGYDNASFGLTDAIAQLSEQSHEICYWVHAHEFNDADRLRFPNTIFHTHSDALQAKPAPEIDISDFSLSKEKIEEFYELEATIMTMMNKKFEKMLIDERKRFYYKLLEYWDGVIAKFRPDAILFITIPHTVYDFIAYTIAKKYGIKTLMFEDTMVNDRCVLQSDYKISPVILRKQANVSLVELSQDLQEYYQYHIGNNPDPAFKDNAQLNAKYWENMYSGWRVLFLKLKVLILSITQGTFLNKVYLFFKHRFGDNIQKEYKSVQSKVDFSQKFIYVPLGYQPERTTCPHGGIFVDQILMIELLSAALPAEWVIYVKEHPAEWLRRGKAFFNYRYRGYYKTIANLPNTKIIPINANPIKLINKSQAVAVVTGTAGWEAVLRSKPVLVFGYIWYQDAPGVFKVRDFDSCNADISKIAKYVANKNEVINYLANFDKSSFHGYIQDNGKQVSSVTTKENTHKIFQALLSALNDSYI